ncbi:MAG: PQQ-binding-like beta-propeller repeat protein [Pirellulaceae bacterium]|nr:PQQ-binding-like beta-propeller repeat protein [Pirellulaceae bacterium]
MLDKRLLLLIPVALYVCTGAMVGRGDDWPRWGGRNDCNMLSTETDLPTSFERGTRRSDGSGIDSTTAENVKWTARLGSITYGTPAVADGRVYVGTNDFRLGDPRLTATRGGVLKCFDEHTGKLQWQLVMPRKPIDKREFAFDHMHLGVCSTATVQEDHVYLVTSRCEVVCLDARGQTDGNEGPFTEEGRYIAGAGQPPVEVQPTDGDIVWLFDMWEDPRVATRPTDAANSSVLIVGDYLYVCTSNGVDQWPSDTKPLVVPAPLAPSLIVLNKKTGRLVAVDDETIGTRMLHGMWSSPSAGQVDDRTLVFFGGGDGWCYAFEALDEEPNELAKLKRVWSFDCNPPHYRVYENGKLLDYRCGDKRNPMSRNENDGTFVGQSEIVATPVFQNNRVYVAIGRDPHHGRGRGNLVCIDATQTGDITETGEIWSYDDIERTVSTVAIDDGLLYIADLPGRIHCLEADTGQCRWVHETKSETWGSTLLADGKIYLGTERALVVLAAGNEPQLLSAVRLGARMDTSPVVANGVLFVASHRYLWAVHNTAGLPR